MKSRLPLLIALAGFLFTAAEAGAQGLPFVTQRTVIQPAPGYVFFPAPNTRPAATPRRVAQPYTVAAPRAPLTPVDPAVEAARKAETAAKVLEHQLKRAEAGAPSAQYDLALRYLKGDGVAQDEAEARKWLTAAAKGGHDRAAAKLKELPAAEKETLLAKDSNSDSLR